MTKLITIVNRLILLFIIILANSFNSVGAFIGGELTSVWQENELKVLLTFYFQSENEAPDSVNAIIKDNSKVERANLQLLKSESNVIQSNYPMTCASNTSFYEVKYSAKAIDLKSYEILQIIISTPSISQSGISSPEVYNSKLALVVNTPPQNEISSSYSWKPFFVVCPNEILSTTLSLTSQYVEDKYSLLPAYISYLETDINPLGVDFSKTQYTDSISFNNPLGNNSYSINEEEKSIYITPKLTGSFLVSEGITSENLVINHRIYIVEISPI